MRNYRLDASQFNWVLLRSFLALYRYGSTAAAARELGMQQPTLSRQLAELEAQLAVTLFERTPKGLHPTAAAEQIYPHVRDIESSANRLCLALQDMGAELTGSVRIYASQLIAITLLPPLLAQLLREHPGLQVELVATDDVPDLLSRDADIGFWLTQPTNLDTVWRKLGLVRIVALASRDYLAACGEPHNVDELSLHRVLGHDQLPVMLDWFRHYGILQQKADFSLRTDDKASYLTALRAGAGIGFASHYVLAQEPGLQQVLPQLPLPEFGLWLSCHRDISNNRLIRTVYDHLSREISLLLQR